jgi:hypothetical protein
MLSGEFDLSTTESRQDLAQTIDKALLLCERCQEPIVCKDQVLWVAKRLGPLTFSNATLVLFYLRNLGLALKEEKPAPKQEAALLRSERIKILCPACRREAVLKS